MESANFSIVEELNKNLTMVVLPVTIFIGVEAVFGFFGNILILIIYTKRYERSNFRYFVLSMAVIDLTSCLTALPGEIFSQMNWYTYEYGWICKVKSYFNVLTAWGSASILLLLAFDRHRKICKPLAWQIQPSLALKMCICSMLLSAIVASPITILWGKQTYVYEFEEMNLTVSICEKSSKYADDIYPLVYIGCVYILPVGIILIVVCSLNIFTARELFGNQSLKISSKSSISSLHTSETTLSNIVTETDLETLSTDKSIAKQCSEVDKENGQQFETSTKSTEHPAVAVSNEEIKSSFSDCCLESNAITESHPDTRTMVSIIAGGGPSSTATNATIIAESKTDFHFDITDISSQNVKNKVKKLKGEQTAPASKSKENESSDFARISSSAGRQRDSSASDFRRKQKTVIMLVLTSVFVFTMLLYVILISFVAGTEGILKTLSNSQKVVFFFFWRLYFINTVINPLLYGFLDPRFRAGLLSLFRKNGLRSGRRRHEYKNCVRQPKYKRPIFTLI